MTFSEHYVGTIVVSVWNVCSMIIEYAILMKNYRRVPRLSFKPLPSPSEKVKKYLSRKLFKSCFAIHDGWKTYFRTRVWPAGVGLAFLYMTVLAFGGVTNTYIRTQGLSESVISVMIALGAAVGIAGTFAFPTMWAKFGLERTGLLALGAQLICLMFCVLSVWLPGSPFDPYFYSKSSNETVLQRAEGNRNATGIDEKKWFTKSSDELPSVVVFLFGMIAARFGLWMADLTITQLIQENVPEKERGIIGGVQSSFNRFMDMLKFVLVICLPNPQTFGFLVITSFAFVATGHIFYAYFAVRSGRQARLRSVPVVVVTRDNQQSPPLLPKSAPQSA
ncbi:solute carrier family 40 member 1-like isoform X2 [Paramacrobiotus metropolitanus]|nr:solute carrier family 40 member 1-like isoform X2 [Paramacrobiotus metropolitanus]